MRGPDGSQGPEGTKCRNPVLYSQFHSPYTQMRWNLKLLWEGLKGEWALWGPGAGLVSQLPHN